MGLCSSVQGFISMYILKLKLDDPLSSLCHQGFLSFFVCWSFSLHRIWGQIFPLPYPLSHLSLYRTNIIESHNQSVWGGRKHGKYSQVQKSLKVGLLGKSTHKYTIHYAQYFFSLHIHFTDGGIIFNYCQSQNGLHCICTTHGCNVPIVYWQVVGLRRLGADRATARVEPYFAAVAY